MLQFLVRDKHFFWLKENNLCNFILAMTKFEGEGFNDNFPEKWLYFISAFLDLLFYLLLYFSELNIVFEISRVHPGENWV